MGSSLSLELRASIALLGPYPSKQYLHEVQEIDGLLAFLFTPLVALQKIEGIFLLVGRVCLRCF
jgi:hypothetical protein